MLRRGQEKLFFEHTRGATRAAAQTKASAIGPKEALQTIVAAPPLHLGQRRLGFFSFSFRRFFSSPAMITITTQHPITKAV
jgi:hypothetical protein